MKRKIYLVLAICMMSFTVHAQKYLTKEGVIEIFSETSLFTIEAKNQSVASILNTENGEVVSTTLVRSFKFREALVEEHFNENYMESHLYPKAIFKGKITNNESINYSVDGTYPISIEGELTMHGVTQPVKSSGKLTVKEGKVSASTDLYISLANFKIRVEQKYQDRIKDEIELKIHFIYSPI